MMTRPRGREHSSLTETASLVVSELKKIPGIKMIAPGEIRPNKNGSSVRSVTASYTNGGFELLISGQSSQKVAVHTSTRSLLVFEALTRSKKLKGFTFKERERRPGI